MIFEKYLDWDTLTIEMAMHEHLEKHGWSVKTEMGFAGEGQTAFIDTARKNKCVIVIHLENDDRQIRIQGGIDGKYLPKGKQVPKYSEIFTQTQLRQASDYFERMVKDLT